MKGCEALIEVFGMARLLIRNFFVTSSLKVYYMSFLKEVLLISSILKIVMREISYDGGFFVRDGSGSIGGGRMDVACFLCLPFLLSMSRKA